jgi:hypothetical protein
MRLFNPLWAVLAAAVKPAGPAPTMITSYMDNPPISNFRLQSSVPYSPFFSARMQGIGYPLPFLTLSLGLGCPGNKIP